MVIKSQTYTQRSKNPEWIKQKKEANKRWYQKNKKRLIAKQREWEKTNPEKVKTNRKKAMQKFVASGKMKNYMKNYYKENKDRCKIRRLTNYYKSPLMIYFKYKCQNCKSKKDLEFHHTSYILKNGNDKLLNLKKITILLCRDCHRKLHNSKKSDLL